MIVPIDSEKRIVGTFYAWELQRVRTRKGELEWEAYKWFSSFRDALGEAVHSEIRLHPAAALAEAIEAVTEVIQKYETLIPSEYRLAK